MEEIKRERIVIDTFFVSQDGKEFTSKYDCEDYEKKVEFENFKPDYVKMKNGFTEELYKDFIYDFIHSFYEFPLKYKELLFSKPSKDVFKNILAIFSDRSRYSAEFEPTRTGYYGNEKPIRKYKEGISVENVYDYFFNKMKLTLSDFNGENDYLLFNVCFHKNDIKAFKILIKHGLNIEEIIDNYTKSSNRGWACTYGYKRDFISALALGDEHVFRYEKIFDVESRAKWLKAILDLDPKITLFKHVPAKTIYENKEKIEGYWSSNSGDDVDIKEIINVSLDDLVHTLQFEYDRLEKKYVKVNNFDKIIKVLLKAKPNFKSLNSNVKNSDDYVLVQETIKYLMLLLCEFPELKSFIDIDSSEVGFIISESISKYAKGNETRTFVEKIAEFNLNESRRGFKNDKKSKVFIYEEKYHVPYSSRYYALEKKVIKFIDLSDYKNKPKELAEKIILHLNNNVPITFESLSEIKDLNDKILETEAYLETLRENRKRI